MIISHNGICSACGHHDDDHFFCNECGALFCHEIDYVSHITVEVGGCASSEECQKFEGVRTT